MYNKKVKEDYLNDKSGLTKKEYSRLFEKISHYEKQINKDVYDFSLEEIMDLFTKLNPKNDKQEKVYRSILKGYINWSIEQGYKNNNVNPLNFL